MLRPNLIYSQQNMTACSFFTSCSLPELVLSYHCVYFTFFCVVADGAPDCNGVTFETQSSPHWSKTVGPIDVEGYGELLATCYNSLGASCIVNACIDSLKVATGSRDGWLFEVKVGGTDITTNGASFLKSKCVRGPCNHVWGTLDDGEADKMQEWNWPTDTIQPDRPPSSKQVGTGLCQPLGIRVYEGNGDNDGTTQQRTDRCASACFNKKTALGYGPWNTSTPKKIPGEPVQKVV